MKDYKLHEDGNLYSVCCFEDNIADRKILLDILNKLSFGSFGVYIEGRRSYYDNSERIAEIIGDKKDFVGIVPFNDADLSFYYEGNVEVETLYLAMVEIWFSYEQPFFCFLMRNDVQASKSNFESRNSSWIDVVESMKSFLIFRGAEEEVVWIGKSADLEWGTLKPLGTVKRDQTHRTKIN